MMVDSKLISQLAGIAKELNSESDNLTKEIVSLNEQLAKLNLGLEFWWDHPRNAIADTGLQYDDNELQTQTFDFLGYDKLDDAWQLGIRTTTNTREWDADNQQFEWISSSVYTPLLKASRDLRLEAASHFDDFLAALKQFAEAQLAKIKKAERSAKIK